MSLENSLRTFGILGAFAAGAITTYASGVCDPSEIALRQQKNDIGLLWGTEDDENLALEKAIECASSLKNQQHQSDIAITCEGIAKEIRLINTVIMDCQNFPTGFEMIIENNDGLVFPVGEIIENEQVLLKNITDSDEFKICFPINQNQWINGSEKQTPKSLPLEKVKFHKNKEPQKISVIKTG